MLAHDWRIVTEHTGRGALAGPAALFERRLAGCRGRCTCLGDRGRVGLDVDGIEGFALGFGLDEHFIQAFTLLFTVDSTLFTIGGSFDIVVAGVHGIEPLVVRQAIRVLDFGSGSSTSALVFVIDNLAREVLANVHAVERRQLRVLHQGWRKTARTAFETVSVQSHLVTLAVHAGERLEFVIPSCKQLVELVVVELVGLFVVVIGVCLECLGLVMLSANLPLRFTILTYKQRFVFGTGGDIVEFTGLDNLAVNLELLLRSSQDELFDSIGRDESQHPDFLLLTDTMGSARGLALF